MSWFRNVVEANDGESRDWARLSENPNVTWEIVKDNLDKPWNWDYLSMNPNITWDVVQANPDKPWSWCCLSANPNISWDIVESNPDKPWNRWNLHANPMDSPYYSSSFHKRKLVKELWDVCGEELIARACHPSRLSQWMAGMDGLM